VYLRVAYIGDDGKLRPSIRTAIMESSQPISARSWRSVPLDLLDLLLDAEWAPNVYEVLTQAAEADPVSDLSAYFDRTAKQYSHIGMVIPTDTVIDGDFELVRDPGGRITDEFLQNLAAMYRWMVASGDAPAPAIADSADVPVSRVHRWVAQARRRGFLPPAIKGKAG
jgi:hypothetical protein